ncbi:ATP-binding protein [Candidatus Uhrbacteria bacterium]|nr:ATP-binding protein [Candidatus Uhrbacteria bacterium]
MIKRLLKIPQNHSFFLFGPRGVGKTTLLKEALPKEKTYYIDLLNIETELRYVRRPQTFAEELRALPLSIRWVVIDEIQKLPFLLDEVHRFIEEKTRDIFFALTGSSARKLKRGQANMLAGRAFTFSLAPFSHLELDNEFNLLGALSYGTLPKLFSLSADDEKQNFLRSYVQTYVKEEVHSEGLIRNLDGFRNFLPAAAAENGSILSWSNSAREAGVQAKTVQSYYGILEDTLLGFLLPAYARSIRKRQKTHPKFYFFDTGVARALAGTLTIPLYPGTTEYGRAFEHFFITEFLRLSVYGQKDFVFSYFATHDIEIDCVIERPGAPPLFVEFKSAEFVSDGALRPLRLVVQSVPGSEGICVSREPRKRRVANILVCPWQEASYEVGLTNTLLSPLPERVKDI